MSEKITFKELVGLIAKQAKQSESSANSFIHELVTIIESGLEQSGSVSISGFGKFELRWMKERSGVNPKTGEKITIPGQNKVVFKPYKALRDEVNSPYANLKSRILDSVKQNEGDSTKDSDATNPLDLDKSSDDHSSESTDLTSDKSHEPLAAFASVSATHASVEDLLIEHDNPHFQSQSKKLIEQGPSKESVPAFIPNESDIAKQVQKSGSFKWSYAAAIIIALIAFIILFFMIQRYQTSSENQIASNNQSEQLISPTTPELAGNEEGATNNEQTDGSDEASSSQSEFETTTVTVNPGQSLWTIADAQLGNPYLWPVLYNLNLDILDNPNQLPASSSIQIPSISDPQNLNSFEREQVALGYFSLYEWSRENNPEEARFFLWAVGVFSPDLLNQPPADVDSNDLEFAQNR